MIATNELATTLTVDSSINRSALQHTTRPGAPPVDDDRRVLVIGSGPSGAIAALTLIEQGIPVTMLESGEQPPAGMLLRALGRNVIVRRPVVDDPGRHIASDDPRAAWFHALTPGGMSNHWSGAVPRFAPEDFTEGERLHERYRWPVSYDDLVPDYERIERLIGVIAGQRSVVNLPAGEVAHARTLPRDWRRVAAYAKQAGHGLTPLPQAAGPLWGVRRTGAGFNSFTTIVRPLLRSPHFQLVLGAHALQLDWSGERRTVQSVTYYDRATGSIRRVAGAAVVLAAGPLASTKLLLDSTSSDFPHGLGNTEGLLGRYLHDHTHDTGTVEFDRPLPRLVQPAYLTRGPYERAAPLLNAAFALGSDLTVDKVLAFTPLKTTTFSYWSFGTMAPLHRNHVRSDAEAKDQFGLPKLDIHVSYDAEVRETMARARERLVAVLDSAGYHCTFRTPLPEFVPGRSIHYGGTVRMHASPQHGMLNGWNRLHAVDNVVVADASAFTTGPEKNPTLTAMALAARAARRLARDLRSS